MLVLRLGWPRLDQWWHQRPNWEKPKKGKKWEESNIFCYRSWRTSSQRGTFGQKKSCICVGLGGCYIKSSARASWQKTIWPSSTGTPYVKMICFSDSAVPGWTQIPLASHVTHVYRGIGGHCVCTVLQPQCVPWKKWEGHPSRTPGRSWGNPVVCHPCNTRRSPEHQAGWTVSPILEMSPGLKHSCLPGPDQVSNISEVEWAAKQEQVSEAHLFMDVTSRRGPGRHSSHLTALAIVFPAVSGKHRSWSRGHWNYFSFFFILIQSSFMCSIPQPHTFPIGVRVLDLWLFLLDQLYITVHGCALQPWLLM